MKFVALVSGGKDSCFNVMHCLVQGHELVGVANLRPPAAAADELDSFMYQTVGSSAVDHYGEAFGVPLWRETITGTAVNQALDYAAADADETEDLYRLLAAVKADRPDVEAVAVGAILSTYQRTRVENVCGRLGLVALAYLWQRADQGALLDEMIAAGVDARLIKTAGVGLTRAHLGQTIGQMRPLLGRLHDRYGLHVCGEGGEYETLVLDAPVFARRLVIDRTEAVVHSADDVAYLHVDAHAEDKPPAAGWEASVAVPPLIDRQLADAHAALAGFEPTAPPTAAPVPAKTPVTTVGRSADTVRIVNVTAPAPDRTVADETAAVFGRLRALLVAEAGTDDLFAISSVTLLLASMADFAAVNAVYRTYFAAAPNPPSRVCISTELAAGCRVQLSVCARLPAAAGPRTGLHVQGRSYWAPANIGPYSQAISAGECTYLAGQIPLVPASLTLPAPDDYATQTVLSLQNLARVASVVAGPADGSAGPEFTGALYYLVAYVASPAYRQAACRLWQSRPEALAHWTCDMIAVEVRQLPVSAGAEWVAVGVNEKHAEEPTAVERTAVRGLAATAYGQTWFAVLAADAVPALGGDAGGIVGVTVFCTEPHFDGAALASETGAAVEVVYVRSVAKADGTPTRFGFVVHGYL
ncbi:uncharacterized protein V1510DRAFT_422049 [Dipodascopsis tothii]|uniref:uncharacterized protein n=1 Tax=Dipodascopsis tothii TaxID=44089 RepID=UPI0034CE27EF